MLPKFELLKKEYDDYYNSLLRQGRLLVRDTSKGIWGVTPIQDAFDFFRQLGSIKGKKFLDIGSGDGKVVLVAALFGMDAVGIEADEELHLKAIEVRDRLNLKAEFILGDFEEHDFSKYDLLFINPDKDFRHGLEAKLSKELRGRLYVFNIVFRPRLLRRGKTFWVSQTPIVEYARH